MIDQLERVRALPLCPVCRQPKRAGLMVCWPCNGKLKARFDGSYGPIDAKLIQLERRIEADQAAALDAGKA